MEKTPLQETAIALAAEMEAFLKEREAGAPVLQDPYIVSDFDGRPLEDDGRVFLYDQETIRQFRERFEARLDEFREEYNASHAANQYFEDGIRMLKQGPQPWPNNPKITEFYVFPAQLKIMAGD